MDYAEFLREVLLQLRSPAFRERYSSLGWEDNRLATQLFREVLALVAENHGYRQRQEVWRIDYLWFTSGAEQVAHSGSRQRSTPCELPKVLIEYENYASNVPAAFARLLGVRGQKRILLAWPPDSDDDPFEPVRAVRALTREHGLFGPQDEVAVAFMEYWEGPDTSAQLRGAKLFTVDGESDIAVNIE